MSDITKLSVLKAYLKYDKLSFQDFYEKGIFKNIDTGSTRLKILGSIIQDFDDIGILKRLSPPISWQIEDYVKANTEYLRLIGENKPLTTPELKNKILQVLIINHNCTKESVSALLNISVQRARSLLQEICNDDKCKRLKGYGNDEFTYQKNEDTESFFYLGGYTDLKNADDNFKASNVTHIHNSKIASINSGNIGGNLNQNSSKMEKSFDKNEESNEDTTVKKATFILAKWQIILALIAIAVAIGIYILQRHQQ